MFRSQKLARRSLFAFFTFIGMFFSAHGESVGQQYYDHINKGLKSYYLKNDFQVAIAEYRLAEKIHPLFKNDLYNLAVFQAQMADYKGSLENIRLAIANGYFPRWIEWNRPMLNKLKQQLSPTDTSALANEYKQFLSSLDYKSTTTLNYLLGRDQAIRFVTSIGGNNQDATYKKALGYAMLTIDSLNYQELRAFIVENGMPDIDRLDHESYSCMEAMFLHLIPEGVDKKNGNFFLNAFMKMFHEGKLANDFLPAIIDYTEMGENEMQLLGTYRDAEYEGFHYVKFKNIEQTDSLRQYYGLPPLYMDSVMRKRQLPAGYHYTIAL